MVTRGKEEPLAGARCFAVLNTAVIHVGKEDALVAVNGPTVFQKQIFAGPEVQSVIGVSSAGIHHFRPVHVRKIRTKYAASVRRYPLDGHVAAIGHNQPHAAIRYVHIGHRYIAAHRHDKFARICRRHQSVSADKVVQRPAVDQVVFHKVCGEEFHVISNLIQSRKHRFSKAAFGNGRSGKAYATAGKAVAG